MRSQKNISLPQVDDETVEGETAYLMASPANAKRLQQAVGQIAAGQTISHELIEV